MPKKGTKKGIRSLLSTRYKRLLETKNADVIPTGFKPLDVQLGGGFAKGQYGMVTGYEGSGKTTLMLHLIKSAQDLGILPIILDTEFAISEQRMKDFGISVSIDKDKFGSSDAIYIQPDSIETVSALLDDIAKWKYNGDIPKEQDILIAWDSLTSTPTDIEIEGDIEDQNIALVSRIISKFVKKHAKYLDPLGITLVLVTQYREKIDINPFSKKVNPLRIDHGKTIPGGNAIRFKTFQLLSLEPTKTFELVKGKPLGRIIKFRTLKNKLINPLLEYEAVLTYTKGFNIYMDMLNALEKNKYLKRPSKGSSSFYLKDYKEPDQKKKEKGLTFQKKTFFKLLKQDKGFYKKCMEYYDKICQNILNPVQQVNDLLDGKEVIEDVEESDAIVSVSDMLEEMSNEK